MTAKISGGQLLCLLLICRVFDLMTFVPLISEGYSFQTQAAAAVISAAVQAVVLIPLIIFQKKVPDRTVTGALIEKNRFAGVVTVFLFLAFFLISTVFDIVSFMRFLNARFFPETGYTAMLAVFAAICIYCAYCGVEGIARSSVFVLIFFLITLAMMLFTSAGNFSTLNFNGRFESGSLAEAVADDIARNSEITAAVFLVRNTGGNFRKGLFGLIASKLLLAELVMAVITGVLGGFSLLTDYPLMEVGSYSKARLFQRNDALYLIVWTLAAVIAVSVFIRIAAGLAGKIFNGLRFNSAAAGIIVFAAALFMLESGISADSGAERLKGTAAMLLTGLVPLAACIAYRKKSVRSEHCEDTAE